MDARLLPAIVPEAVRSSSTTAKAWLKLRAGKGKPDFAMGGGKDMLMLDNALAMVDNFVAMKLGLLKEDK